MLTTVRSKLIGLCALLAVFTIVAITLLTTPAARGAQATPEAAATPTPAMTSEDAIAAITGADGVLRFDVAEDPSRFVFAPQPLHEDGMPAYGNSFVTQGYIYPEGTLSGTNGVLPDGSPEFPDQVLGEWTCRGWFVGDGAHTTTGPMVITTQVYNFGAELGDAMLTSEGAELVDIGVAIERAVSGGTGQYAGARGQANQTLLGFTEQLSVNLRFALTLAS